MRPDLEYVKTLERENRQLRNESEFIKSLGVHCRRPEEKYAIIRNTVIWSL